MRVLAKPDTDCEFDFSPTCSPDGQTILFSHESCSYPPELYTVPAAGGTPHDLHVAGDHPAWGPFRIAYINDGIWTANPDGSDPVKVAKDGMQPAWSPDGRLAYRVGRFGNIVAVGSTEVTLPFASVTSLSWSPDGTRFVVTARRTITSPIDLCTIRTDGTDPVQLTKDFDASGASWR